MLNFLGIGAQKAGTTWLYHQLSRHPEIHFPAGKEIHYWNRVQAGFQPEELDSYRALFADASKCQGEITPAYALLELAFIRKIHALNPDLRIFYVLRNPMARAWSAACMELARLGMTMDEAGDRWFIDVFRSRQSLDRGDYETTLRRWQAVFPKDQILILFYESIAREPRSVLMRLAAHLGVDPAFFATLPESSLRERINHPSIPPYRRCPPSPPLMVELRYLYEERILSLSRYLGRDLSHWLAAILDR